MQNCENVETEIDIFTWCIVFHCDRDPSYILSVQCTCLYSVQHCCSWCMVMYVEKKIVIISFISGQVAKQCQFMARYFSSVCMPVHPIISALFKFCDHVRSQSIKSWKVVLFSTSMWPAFRCRVILEFALQSGRTTISSFLSIGFHEVGLYLKLHNFLYIPGNEFFVWQLFESNISFNCKNVSMSLRHQLL